MMLLLHKKRRFSRQAVTIQAPGKDGAGGTNMVAVMRWPFLKTTHKLFAWGIILLITPGAYVRAGDALSTSSESVDALPPGAIARLGSLRLRQGSPVAYLAYVLDGKAVLSVGRQPLARLFDATTGKLLREFQFADPQESGRSRNGTQGQPVAVSPDGRQLVLGYGAALQLFDIASGKQLRAFERPVFALHLVAFSPDGKTVVAAGKPVNGDEHDKWISAIMAPQLQSKRKKAPTPKGKVQIWDVGTGKSLRILEAVDGSVASLAIAPDCKRLAVGGEGYDLRLWDMGNGKELRSFPFQREASNFPEQVNPEIQRIAALAFSPDGKTLVSAGGDLFPGGHQMMMMSDTPTLDVWDPATGKHLHRLLKDEYNGFAGVAFSPNGQTLASAGRGGLYMWEMPSARQFFSFHNATTFKRNPAVHLTGLAAELSSVAFAPDGKTVCFGTETGTLHFWDIKAGKEVTLSNGHSGAIFNVAFAPDSHSVATSSVDSTTRIWQLPDGIERKQFPSGMFPGGALAFSADGASLLIVDATGRWVNVADGRLLKEFKADGNYIGHQAIACAGAATFLEVSMFSPLRFRHVAPRDGKPTELPHFEIIINPSYEMNAIEGIALSRNGRVGALASGKQYPGEHSTNRRISIWDTKAEKETQHWTIDRQITGLALAPDGKLLASCNEHEIHFWDSRTGKEVGPPLQLACVQSKRTKMPMAFSADGKLFAAGWDRIEVWDVASRARRYQLSGHRAPVKCLAFDDASRYLASGSDDTTALVWDLSKLGSSAR
jgi:WD40 repeat protein